MPDEFSFDYYYGDESESFSFFRIPRLLITSSRFKELSTEAKLLYGILLDRMGLSRKNGWIDEQGRVYIHYPLDEIQEVLNCGHDKALKLLAQLVDDTGIGLVERIKQGQGRPAKLYIKRFTTAETSERPNSRVRENRSQDFGKVEVKTSEKPKSRVRKSRSQDFGKTEAKSSEKPKPRVRKSRSADFGKTEGSYTNKSYTDISYTNLSIPPSGSLAQDGIDGWKLREEIRDQISYGLLKPKNPGDELDELVELIAEVLWATSSTIRVNGQDLPASMVQDRFYELRSDHIEYVLESLSNTTNEIHNIRAYLLTALYNAPVTIGHYYAAEFRKDVAAGAFMPQKGAEMPC